MTRIQAPDPQNGQNPGPGPPKWAKSRPRPPKISRSQLRIPPKWPKSRLQTPKLAQIQGPDPEKGPNPGLRPPKWPKSRPYGVCGWASDSPTHINFLLPHSPKFIPIRIGIPSWIPNSAWKSKLNTDLNWNSKLNSWSVGRVHTQVETWELR